MTTSSDLWLHIACYASPYRVDYLRTAFARAKRLGYTGVFLDYIGKFPYSRHRALRGQGAYSVAECAQIENAVRTAGLRLCVRGHSFSHSDQICQTRQYRHLADTAKTSLDLTQAASLTLMCELGDEILSLHPSLEWLHVGGDEIPNFAHGPRSSTLARQVGRSALYVQYVNKLARHFARRGKRIAIWSDMLIRYPEAINQLDRSVVIFYWDYWGYGDRVPFVSIGGGCPDMFMLDRAAMTGDLEKMFRWPLVRPKTEIPVGHMDHFGKYWQLDAKRRSARSFPYLQWFRERGFDVVGSLLSYPEKGSFLPQYGEQIEHVRGWVQRGREQGVTGYLSCLWQPAWPCLEATWPGHALVAALAENPARTGPALYQAVAEKLACGWSATTVKKLLHAPEHFEFGDMLDPFWGNTPVSKRLAWLEEACWLADDNGRARRSVRRLKPLVSRRVLAGETFVGFAARDLLWRAKAQLALARKQSTTGLYREGRALRTEYAGMIARVFKAPAVRADVVNRYHPWLKALQDRAQGKNAHA